MSAAISPSTGRVYGVQRVCRVWERARSAVYTGRSRHQRPSRPPARRGPKTAWTDEALTEQVRLVLARSSFLGEGHRKVWARLRLAGTRTSQRPGCCG